MNRKSGQSWPFRFHLEPASQTLMQFFLFMICNIQKRFKFQLIFGRLPGANKKKSAVQAVWLWATFQSLWTQLICPNLIHSNAILVKVSKYLIFLLKSFLGNFLLVTLCARCPVWPDWAIFSTLGKFFKPLATINLPKTLTFLGNFCKGIKIYHFSSEIIFEQLL